MRMQTQYGLKWRWGRYVRVAFGLLAIAILCLTSVPLPHPSPSAAFATPPVPVSTNPKDSPSDTAPDPANADPTDAETDKTSQEQTAQTQFVSIPASRQATNVVIITVKGTIDQVTVRSIQRRLILAEQAGADAVVFEIDTFGGNAAAALEICEIIKNSPIQNTVAWIHTKAYSAGTFIAFACQEIVMSPIATIGDCAPILPGLIPIPPAERAKIESPLLAEIVDSSRRHGYDEKLAIAFVAVDIELWQVENLQTGDRLFVDRVEYGVLFEDEPPMSMRTQASGGPPPGSPGGVQGQQPKRVLPFHRGFPEKSGPPMTAEQRDAAVEFQQALASSRPILTNADRGKYVLVDVVIDNMQLLVLKTEKAQRYGIAENLTITSDSELKTYFGASSITRLDQTWSESLVQMLTVWPVKIALVIIVIIGLVWEMAAPGLGLPGAIGVAALLILIGAPALTGMAQWWDVLFIFLGILLIAGEIFVIPGFGIAGISGTIFLCLGFVGLFIAPHPGGGVFPVSPDGKSDLLRGVVSMLVAIFGTGVAFYMLSKHIGSLPIFNKLVLLETGLSRGPAPATSVFSAMATGSRILPQKGDVGVAITPLHPIGRARINGQILDVIADRGMIKTGDRICVKSANKLRIFVEKDESA